MKLVKAEDTNIRHDVPRRWFRRVHAHENGVDFTRYAGDAFFYCSGPMRFMGRVVDRIEWVPRLTPPGGYFWDGMGYIEDASASPADNGEAMVVVLYRGRRMAVYYPHLHVLVAPDMVHSANYAPATEDFLSFLEETLRAKGLWGGDKYPPASQEDDALPPFTVGVDVEYALCDPYSGAITSAAYVMDISGGRDWFYDDELGGLGADGAGTPLEVRPNPVEARDYPELFDRVLALLREAMERLGNRYCLNAIPYGIPLGCHVHIGTFFPSEWRVVVEEEDYKVFERLHRFTRPLQGDRLVSSSYGRPHDVRGQSHGQEIRFPPSSVMMRREVWEAFGGLLLSGVGVIEASQSERRQWRRVIRKTIEEVNGRWWYCPLHGDYHVPVIAYTIAVEWGNITEMPAWLVEGIQQALAPLRATRDRRIRIIGLRQERGLVSHTPELVEDLRCGYSELEDLDPPANSITIPYVFRWGDIVQDLGMRRRVVMAVARAIARLAGLEGTMGTVEDEVLRMEERRDAPLELRLRGR